MPRSVTLRLFGNRTSIAIADVIEPLVPAAESRRVAFGEEAYPADLEVFVLPVLGDDRIPDQVERWLSNAPLRSPRHLVCLSGDFTIGETPRSRVSEEANRILTSRGSLALGEPIILDTPLSPGWEDLLSARFEALLVSSDSSAPLDAPRAQTSAVAVPLHAETAFLEICGLLGATPRATFDNEGTCRSLDFTDGARYPRNILVGQREGTIDAVFEAVGSLGSLRTLSLAYAGLDRIPRTLPAKLRELDLTCNPIRDFRALSTASDLRWLNIAACDQPTLPDEVVSLPKLHTLIAAKNRINSVPGDTASMTSLRRLTLYRNRFVRLEPALAALQRVQILNIGAGPVETLDAVAGGLPELRGLGVCMTAIKRFPESLYQLPKLMRVDVSKNPQFDRAGVPIQHRHLLASSMLGWNTLGTHEHETEAPLSGEATVR